MSRLLSLLLLALATVSSLNAQVQNEKGEFLFEPPIFSPPEQDQLNSLINSKAMNFMTKDLDGNDYLLNSFSKDNILLLFWDINDTCSRSLLDALSSINLKGIKVMALSNENKTVTSDYLSNYKTDFPFPILTNGRFVGQLGFGESLGCPRLFFIGYESQIKEVLPPSYLCKTEKLHGILETYIRKIYGL